MLVNDGTITVIVLVERDPGMRTAQLVGQEPLPFLNGLPPHVLAVKFDQIKRAERDRPVMLPPADHVENGETVFIAGDRLAIDDAGARRQRSYSRYNERKALAKIVPVAGNQPDTRTMAPR